MNLHESTDSPTELMARVTGATLILLAAFSLALMGCAKREKVIEVDTPAGSVDVEKVTHPDGDVDIDVDADK